MKQILFVASLIIIALSIILIIEYPYSQRMHLYSGITLMIGFALNIGAFIFRNSNIEHSDRHK